MLRTKNIIAFVAATDRKRTRVFYEDILGLQTLADEPEALVMDANGSMLRISFLQKHTPPPYTVLGWHVDDIEEVMAGLRARNVVFEQFDGIPQDGQGVCAFPNGDRVAWFRDPAGNMLSLTQFH